MTLLDAILHQHQLAKKLVKKQQITRVLSQGHPQRNHGKYRREGDSQKMMARRPHSLFQQ